ncbi:radical SAM protein [Marinitoga litoralis]|uniref:radical SAM protein n=1 Tax=Marinitoga litoralis TaxID=570855 RepID=UPI0019617712|nr:radical SAM protein [Marinitoga litoralis]MBM7560263.1 putative Fe-S cluster-containing radical SAM superfamily protein [Marinitoga litoralis]
MYKESYYNYFLEIDKIPVLVNLRTGAIAEVNRENVQKIKETLKGNIVDKELFEQLKYDGYIIEKDYNEYEEIKMRNYRARFDNSRATFTIIPTFQCNFDCVYCYETKRNKIMTIEKAEEIADYIINTSKNKKIISIGWFGGEPLMNFKVIECINKKIIDESEAELFSSMSSNGCLWLE